MNKDIKETAEREFPYVTLPVSEHSLRQVNESIDRDRAAYIKGAEVERAAASELVKAFKFLSEACQNYFDERKGNPNNKKNLIGLARNRIAFKLEAANKALANYPKVEEGKEAKIRELTEALAKLSADYNDLYEQAKIWKEESGN